MASLKDKEKIAAVLAVGITAGINNLKGPLEQVFCPISGKDESESALLSMIATAARLMALEIVLMQSGAASLRSMRSELSDLMFEVRRGTLAAHVVSGVLSKNEADEFFPEMRIQELLTPDWEKQATMEELTKALKESLALKYSPIRGREETAEKTDS